MKCVVGEGVVTPQTPSLPHPRGLTIPNTAGETKSGRADFNFY